MKKLFKLTSLLLLVTMLFNLVACSSFGKISKALEDVGYAQIQNEEESSDVANDAKEDESVTKVYVFTNAESLSLLEAAKITLVTVIEFNATEDLVEYFKDNNTLQGIVEDIKEDGTAEEIYNELKDAGLACGNCLIAPLGLDAKNVLNAIKELNK